MRFLAFLLLLLPSTVYASDIVLHRAYSYELKKGSEMGVIYMTIENKGAKEVALGSVLANAICHTIELHVTEIKNGVASMRKVDSIPIPPHSKVELKPGGPHLMLIGIKQALLPGDSFPATFNFIDGQSMSHVVQIESRDND